jgi:hypothetical protein
MDGRLHDLLQDISNEFAGNIEKGARNYIQVNIGERAARKGYPDLGKKYQQAGVIVPLRNPLPGMKVRIDGRTFVRYALYDSGLAVPGFVADEAGLPYEPYVPNDSMILNFH